MSGFAPRKVVAPVVVVPVSREVREVLVRHVAAIVCGMTPEEALNMLVPSPGRKRAARATAKRLGQWLSARPLEADEMSAHVDVLLVALQSPAAG